MVMSSIAIREWMNQKKLVASSSAAISVARALPLANQTMRVNANRPIAPPIADGTRQYSGSSPSQRSAAANTVLPNIGCSGLTRIPSSSLRAAGT